MAAHDRSTYEKDVAALIKNQTDIRIQGFGMINIKQCV